MIFEISLDEIKFGDQLATAAGVCCQNDGRGWCIWKRRYWEDDIVRLFRSDLDDNCFVWKR